MVIGSLPIYQLPAGEGPAHQKHLNTLTIFKEVNMRVTREDYFADKEAVKSGYICSKFPTNGCDRYRYYTPDGKEHYVYCNYDPSLKASGLRLRLCLIPAFIFVLLFAIFLPLKYKLVPCVGLCVLVYLFIRVGGRKYIPYAFKVEEDSDNEY